MDILLGYDEKFAPLVERGEKLSTIRRREKTFAEPADTLHHYCRRRPLGASTCESVLDIDIFTRLKAVFIQVGPGGGQRRMGNQEVSALAAREGFPNTTAFYDYFSRKSGHHHAGSLITWPEIHPF